MNNKYKHLIFYQIYIKSFYDSNGDGIGDIRGVISKIDYLKALGINAVWLTPFYQTPDKDNGYDISDYCAVNADMGTMNDVEILIKALHKNGMFVVVDLVANHTSTEHVWFKKSRSNKAGYRDYYLWRKTPPNAWKSVFGGTAWQFDETRGEYYLASFTKEQADLNWDNPKVRQEFEKIIDFWLKKGVDGFRCDVLDMISKDFKRGKNGNGENLHTYIRELFHRKGVRCFTVGECWSADIESAKLLTHPSRKELTTLFSFWHLCLEKGRFAKQKPTLCEMCARLSAWQTEACKAGLIPTVFLENHDLPRSVTRFGNDEKYRYESATLLGAMLLTHYGIPFVFQGEEIGLTNSVHKTVAEHPDVESQNFYYAQGQKIGKEERLKRINAGGRDNGRRMMPWTEKIEKSWIPPYEKQEKIHVFKDVCQEQSVFRFYQRLIALRKKEKCLTEGWYKCLLLTKEKYVFSRTTEKEKIVVVCALGKGTELPPFNGKVLLSNYTEISNPLKPYQVIIYKED